MLKGLFYLFRYTLYKRVFSCFLLALLFSLTVLCITICLSIHGYGVSFSNISGAHDYKIANPITIVSFAATFVTISLTVIGFALNSFSKRRANIQDSLVLGNSIYEEAVGILLVRYRKKSTTLLYLNVFNFPLLAKAFSLVLLLGGMFVHCFIGHYRVFYLIVYASLMFCVIVSMLLCVFEIYSDINFTSFKACRIISYKIIKRLRFLIKTNKDLSVDNWTKGLKPSLRIYARTDVFRAIIFLYDCLKQVLYRPTYLKITYLINNSTNHFLSELALCFDTSDDMRLSAADLSNEKRGTESRTAEIINALDYYFSKCIKYEESESMEEALNKEIMFLNGIGNENYYYASKKKILEHLERNCDRIKVFQKDIEDEKDK